MQTFISETISSIAKENTNFNNVVLIVPSQRSKVFVKKAIKNEISKDFLPKILNIEEFISDVSGITKIESISLLFHFYEIYRKQETEPDSFDIFSSWAITVIQDFNEIDQHLIDAKSIFTYIRDIQRLKKWSIETDFSETELMKNHYRFLEKLHEYYDLFYTFLIENKIGYQGVLYKETVNNLDHFNASNKNSKFYFIGFNSLNGAEQKIIQQMLEYGNSDIYWDIDSSFLEDNHQAGTFIHKYLKNWKYYQKNKIKIVSNHFLEEKNIEVTGVTKNVTQIKYAGKLLSKLNNIENTALVLADETLLPIVLQSLPNNTNQINITMGYPLKDIPTTHLIITIFQLFINQKKLKKQNGNSFYYKNVISIIKQTEIQKFIENNNTLISEKIIEDIAKYNKMFIDKSYIENFFEDTTCNKIKVFLTLFNPFTNTNEFLKRIIYFLSELKEFASTIEKEFLFRYYTIFTQLDNLHQKFGFLTDIKTLDQFFKQLINSENLSFQGEPLEGLQIMGMLETRLLDFKNVIITSVNEGILPSNSQLPSFVPFDVKVEFGLPTYREKDAVFSYHFFRLLKRAKNVHLLYNTETDAFGKGEKSRFIKQLQLLNPKVNNKIISPKVISYENKLREIVKNKEISKKLQKLAKKGISPSAIATYLYNPIAFYQQKILHIKETENVEETIANNTMGTVVHDTLEELYIPHLNKFLVVEDINKMYSLVRKVVTKYFTTHFVNGDITKGKNRLIFEVAVRFVENFLKQEKKLLSNSKNKLRVIATEQKMSALINIDELDFTVKIHGTVDRIDELNGVLRIIDYKTGKVESSSLRVTDFKEINDYKYHKAIQVLLYAYMYLKNNQVSINQEIEAGIISFKNLNSGFLSLNFANGQKKDNTITLEKIEEFEQQLKLIISEIYCEKNSFIEPKKLAF